MKVDAEIKKLSDQLQGLQVEKAQLNDRRTQRAWGLYEARQTRLIEIEAEIAEIKQQLAEAQGKAVAGAIGKG